MYKTGRSGFLISIERQKQEGPLPGSPLYFLSIFISQAFQFVLFKTNWLECRNLGALPAIDQDTET
jgi:hypothetical protein